MKLIPEQKKERLEEYYYLFFSSKSILHEILTSFTCSHYPET